MTVTSIQSTRPAMPMFSIRRIAALIPGHAIPASALVA
jgi:hypothetical protein